MLNNQGNSRYSWNYSRGDQDGENFQITNVNSRFKDIRMLEDESFNEFYEKLNNIVNFRFNLVEKVEDSWIIRKILRSLPERFWPKVIAIEENEDLETICVEELMGFL